MNTKIIKQHEFLFTRGQPSQCVYRIKRGKFEVLQDHDNTLGEAKVGEYIGELGVLHGTTRNASLRALTDCEVLEYNKDQFIDLISSDKDEALKIIHSLSCRTRGLSEFIETLLSGSKESKSFFSNLLVSLQNSLSFLKFKKTTQSILSEELTKNKDLQYLSLSKGEILFEEKTASDRVYFVIDGKLNVSKMINHKEKIIGSINTNEFVGEMGILETMPRTATAKSTKKSRLIIYTPEQFLNLITENEHVRRHLIESLSQRAITFTDLIAKHLSANAQFMSEQQRSAGLSLLSSVENVLQLSGKRLEQDFNRLKDALSREAENMSGMVNVYQKYLKDQATPEEIERANALFINYLKMLGVGTLFLLPGSVITLPIAIKTARSMGIEILPKFDKRI